MWCFLDVETTGVNLFQDHTLEIGAVLVDEDLRFIKEFHSFVRPDKAVNFSNASKQVHGFEESFFYDKSDSAEVIEKFFNDMGTNFRFISWNISFDVGFFRKLCHLNKMTDKYNKINYRHIDLQSIFYWYCVENNLEGLSSLDDACNYFDIPRSRYHNALEDAYIAYEIFKKINNRMNFSFL
ncbi:3'-5' exonuclease [Acinetobacter sp. ME22]|uniref:3'-5' exonuclease n=1 Tax=Acinetobacter sp. ME22 TaxID=2904802 RepID=UPI001EDB6B1F|nr:3'-5' exonuclease [Acinetobacter sp. ME22]MCG2572419.1 3'-5' exonuclease [Acinetobacter sp. ME22]